MSDLGGRGSETRGDGDQFPSVGGGTVCENGSREEDGFGWTGEGGVFGPVSGVEDWEGGGEGVDDVRVELGVVAPERGGREHGKKEGGREGRKRISSEEENEAVREREMMMAEERKERRGGGKGRRNERDESQLSISPSLYGTQPKSSSKLTTEQVPTSRTTTDWD